MRLFGYYAFHTVKNQIRKLLKTWVAVFLLVCMVLGMLIGFGAAMLSDLADNGDDPSVSEPSVGDPSEHPPVTQEPMGDEGAEQTVESVHDLVELIALGVILLVLLLEVLQSDKNGSVVFLGSDVNLLFPSPLKPQSVLLFRLTAQIGATLFASVYLLLQLPNLVSGLGVGILGALAVIFAWSLTLIYGKLFHILLYTIGSTYPRIKPRIRPTVFAVIGVLAASFFVYWRSIGTDGTIYQAAVGFFNHPLTRYIPVVGWLKGFCMYAIEGSLVGTALSLVALLAIGGLMTWWIWHIRADFYEDAMAKSEETAALQAAAAEGRAIRAKRKKDRSDRLLRDGIRHGLGANVFFFKAMYNRFRFSHLRIFTKTSETYLAVGIVAALAMRYLFEYPSFLVVAAVLGVIVFFRSLGNPLSQDTQVDLFRMLPESPWAKMLWSLLGGTANCFLDLLPATVAAALILRAAPLEVLGWLLVILSVDFYSTNVGVFIDLSVPIAAGKPIKSIVQIMFIYFGLLPDIAILALGGVFSVLPLATLLAAVFNVMVGLLFFIFSPMLLERGSK